LAQEPIATNNIAGSTPISASPTTIETNTPLSTQNVEQKTTSLIKSDAPLTMNIAPDAAPSAAPVATTAFTPTASAGGLMPVSPPPLPSGRLDNAIQDEAERALQEAKQKRYQTTYEKAYEGLVPLGPNEVRDTMTRYERTQRAAVPPSSGQPKGQVRVKTLSLEPGSEPQTINVSAGYVTTIAIVDATGEPWPILDLGIGGNFEVSKTGGGDGGSHVVRVMPLTRFGYGNLSILLKDLSTPIIFKLASGGSTVDYRFDGRVPRMGPQAKVSLIDRKGASIKAGSAEIMTFLDNAPPPNAKRVRVSGTDSRTLAWQIDNRMFVRTPLTMISPSWDASVASADGTTVYEMNETPVMLMSDNGTLIRARVTPKEDDQP
jgi:intracellular multiplication protein IcmK